MPRSNLGIVLQHSCWQIALLAKRASAGHARRCARLLPDHRSCTSSLAASVSSHMLTVTKPRSWVTRSSTPRGCRVRASSRAELEQLGRQLYEEVWSTGNVAALDTIMTEDHVQRDQLYQRERTEGGRERMQRGIAAYRGVVPGLTFTVQHVAVDEPAQTVTVEWTNDPGDGGGEGAIGVSVLTVRDGRIAETRVYRSVPQQEADSRQA